jgi:regulator of RNase E activity RraA
MATSPFVALDAFDWTTPFIADACVRLELPVRQGPPGLMPLLSQARVAGPVAPVVHSGSADVLLEAIAAATWGDVLVVDNNGRLDEGCIGNLLAGEALTTGLAAIVIDGAHRDSAAIRALGIPLWSRGRCAFGPRELRRRHLTALQAATCGSTTVTREDAVFADEDGVVFVTLAHCARVIDAARAIAMQDQAQAGKIEGGQPLREQVRLADFIARRDADPEYTFKTHVEGLTKS